LVQALPAMQGEQDPPQSTSTSSPFLTRSAQLATAQLAPLQMRLWQSLAALQTLPAGQ
jgi:hypothetical protein